MRCRQVGGEGPRQPGSWALARRTCSAAGPTTSSTARSAVDQRDDPVEVPGAARDGLHGRGEQPVAVAARHADAHAAHVDPEPDP